MVPTITFSVYLGLSESAGGEGGGGDGCGGRCWHLKAGPNTRGWGGCFATLLLLLVQVVELDRPSPARPGPDRSWMVVHTWATLPGECSCKRRAVRAWCMVRGAKRVSVNTSREQTSAVHCSSPPWQWLMTAAPLWKAGGRAGGRGRGAGAPQADCDFRPSILWR